MKADKHEGCGPAGPAGRDRGRHGAVGDLGQSQARKHRRFEQTVEHTEQKHDKADQRDQGADFLAQPDLVVRGTRRAALQGLGEPVEAVADGLMRNMLGRVRHIGRIQHPGGALRDVAIDLARVDGAFGAKQRPEFGALRDVARPLDAPHQVRKFLVLGEHQRDIARPARGALGGERLAGRGSLQHHRLVVVGHRGRGGKDGPAAHRMALKADIVLVDEVEAAQMRQPIGAAKAVGEGRRIAVAVAGLVERQHHIAPAGKFDGEAILGLARIDVAVHRQNAGGRGLGGRVGRDVEQGTHDVALGAGKPNIPDLDAAGGLRQISQHGAGQNQNRSGNGQ